MRFVDRLVVTAGACVCQTQISSLSHDYGKLSVELMGEVLALLALTVITVMRGLNAVSDLEFNYGLEVRDSGVGYHEMVAMVYKNEHNEVSYYTSGHDAVSQIDSSLSSIALIFVLSFVALVTISRRNSTF